MKGVFKNLGKALALNLLKIEILRPFIAAEPFFPSGLLPPTGIAVFGLVLSALRTAEGLVKPHFLISFLLLSGEFKFLVTLDACQKCTSHDSHPFASFGLLFTSDFGPPHILRSRYRMSAYCA